MSFWPKPFNCWSTVWLDFVLRICFMLNIEQLTKMLGAAVQQLQQQFVQQQENFQKQQTDVQKKIGKQQDILQKILLKQGEREKGLNTFSAEGIANSLSEFINLRKE